MKVIVKRFAAMLLLGLLTVGIFASCAKKENDAPDGMMIASAAGADYYLYVPTTWNLNTFYGISGAYRNASSQSTVSVNRYSADGFSAEEGVNRNAAWWEQTCLPLLNERDLNRQAMIYADDSHSTVFGGADAVYRHASVITGGKRLHFVQVVAERGGYFYLFSLSVVEEPEEFYLSCRSDTEKMIEEFTFADEPYYPEKYAWKPAKVTAPDGMQVASSDEVAYRFFVPSNWVVDRDVRIFSAYEPNDRTNVSVTAYMPPNDEMKIEEFFEEGKELMIETAGAEGYRLIEESNDGSVTLGDCPAARYEFTYVIDVNTYHYQQIIARYRGMFYTVTYTADEAHYTAHLDEWNAILQAFIFR